MPTTITTANANGLGYQTGFFSGPVGEALNQTFFDAAFAGFINTNKIFKTSYHCDIVRVCGLSQWLEEYGGVDTDCFPAYSLIETYGRRNLIKVQTGVAIPAYPGTAVIELDPGAAYTSNAYILPQVGNSIVLPCGELAKVTAVGTASALDPKITVQLRNRTATQQSVAANDELLVLSGSEILDCACPTGQFAVPALPIITDLEMINVGDKGEVCGDAALKCQWLKIPFTDECGNKIEHWYTEALSDMYRRHEMRKFYEKLLNPTFGIIPLVKARGIKWTPASATEITTDDVRTWKQELDKAGVNCREFAIFAGRTLFSQWQRMLLTAGVTQLLYSERPYRECGWINMEYCGIQVEGLTLHIYEECTFSNGKELGSGSSVFPASAIIVPMCPRPMCNRAGTQRGEGGDKGNMYSTVYFRDNTGRVWDNLTDSNGMFGPRNTFGAGCEQHEWTIKSRWTGEPHCMNHWGFMGLTC